MRSWTNYFIVILIIFFGTGCRSSNGTYIPMAAYQDMKQVRLGETDYYIQVPNPYVIEEANGKEGQLGYSINLPGDSLLVTTGFIEIEEGSPIHSNNDFFEPDTDTAKGYRYSDFLNRKIEWIIRRTATGRYIATVGSGDRPSPSASADKMSGIDSMIAVLSTVYRKRSQ